MKAAAALFLFLACSCSPPVSAVTDMDGKAKTLLLESPTGSCGASALAPDLVLTAEHCLAAGDAFKLTASDGRSWDFKADRGRAVDGNDHLLVRLPVQAFEARDLVRMRATWFQETERLTLWGHAAGLAWTFREARVARVDREGLAGIACECFMGDSGSPIFDSRGLVVGVVNLAYSWSNVQDKRLYHFQLMAAQPFAFKAKDLARLRD